MLPRRASPVDWKAQKGRVREEENDCFQRGFVGGAGELQAERANCSQNLENRAHYASVRPFGYLT